MYPELFRIGNFPIATYGLLVAVGMIAALMVASRLSKSAGLANARIYDLGLWAIIGGVVGSRLLLVLTDDTVSIVSFDILRSGGVFFGGLMGGFLTLVLAIRYYGLPFLKTADTFAPGVALGQAIGRLGCFASGDSWGKPTDLPWGIRFTELANTTVGVPNVKADGSPLYLHPVQIYESIAMFVVFGGLLWLSRRRRFDGQALIAYALIYPAVRFAIEFFRDDPRGDVWKLTTATGLSTSQLISVVIAGTALLFLVLRQLRGRRVQILTTSTFVVLAVVSLVISTRAQNEKPIRVETRLVNINVSVTDKRGEYVSGLKAEQFELLVDGKQQTNSHFSHSDSPVALGVVLDIRPFSGERLGIILASLRQFSKTFDPADDLFVLAFDQRGSFVFDFVPTEEQIQTELYMKRAEPNSLYDAICLAAEKLRERNGVKETLLVISDGADSKSRHDLSEMRRHLSEFDAGVYALLLDKAQEETQLIDLVQRKKFGRVNISKNGTLLDRAAIQELTKSRGGMYHASAMKNVSEIYELLDKVTQDVRRQYTIGFYPDKADAVRHRIKIKLVPTNGSSARLFVAYRREYSQPNESGDR